jgi:hypothetical protein
VGNKIQFKYDSTLWPHAAASREINWTLSPVSKRTLPKHHTCKARRLRYARALCGAYPSNPRQYLNATNSSTELQYFTKASGCKLDDRGSIPGTARVYSHSEPPWWPRSLLSDEYQNIKSSEGGTDSTPPSHTNSQYAENTPWHGAYSMTQLYLVVKFLSWNADSL